VRSLRRRDRLGRLVPPPPVPHLYLACLDEAGRVLDDGSEAARRWIVRHYAELPAPVHVIAGLDPLRVLGLPAGARAARADTGVGDEG
jgi:hypothetical protein